MTVIASIGHAAILTGAGGARERHNQLRWGIEAMPCTGYLHRQQRRTDKEAE